MSTVQDKDFRKEDLKILLSLCTEQEHIIFKRMYSHENLNVSIDECVDNMDESKVDWALTQVERTIEHRRK